MITFILVVLILISILIGMTIHELGHFTFAKIFKVNVKEFSIGIGPKLFQWKTKKGTRVSLRLIPLMAYVLIDNQKTVTLYNEILVEHLSQKDSIDKRYNLVSKSGNFFSKSYMNFRYKKYYSDLSNYEYMSSVQENSLLLDDVQLWKKNIIFFGGVFFNLISFFIFWLIQYFGFNVHDNPFVQVGQSLLTLLKNMVFMGNGIGTVFGSIANVSQSSNGFQGISGFDFFKIIFNFLTLFSIMLFIYNLLPIPPLDGYKIMIETLQKWFKFKISKKAETIITIIGFLILIYIFITSIIADII
ncbi:site-2 protease family protein [Malacoplasma muris]|uniref:site-2 protease family protein n=1 Tax=Malacoplasma muris TaxID=2119 RepID=UPI00398E397E